METAPTESSLTPAYRPPATEDLMAEVLGIYNWPSQAYWRYFEIRALRRLAYKAPILEIGCGDGKLTSLILTSVDSAIDINPKAVENCKKSASHVYRDIRCQDARELQQIDDRYGTVFANCVFEHIPDIENVLRGCHRSLRAGGKLVITVPLVRMNEHLLIRSPRYAHLRQRQLVHVNLLSEDGWTELLTNCGFNVETMEPYISSRACRFWDTLDALACIGYGRYTLAAAVHRIGRAVLPSRAKKRLVMGSRVGSMPKPSNTRTPAPQRQFWSWHLNAASHSKFTLANFTIRLSSPVSIPGRPIDRRNRWPRLLGREVGAIGMVEHQGADAGFRLHHHAFGEAHADFLGAQQLPDALLVVQVGAGGIAEAVALAAVAGGEAVVHGEGGRIGEAPILADAAVQPFGGGFGGFDGQRLDGVGFEELAGLLPRPRHFSRMHAPAVTTNRAR